MSDEEEALAFELDMHMLALIKSDGKQASAIAWMKKAYLLMERCSADLKKLKIYSVPGTFGANTFTVVRPTALILPPAGFKERPLVWSKGQTIAYGNKYQDRHVPRAFTARDSRRLEQQRLKNKSAK